MSNYPSITVKKEREKALTNRHPWLFSGAIEGLEPEACEGDIVRILNYAAQLVGYGHYQGNSRSIAARIFHFSKQAIEIDDNFWTARFQNALELRKQLGLCTPTSGYRLIYSEGDFVPGLVVDIFGDCASIQITSAGVDKLEQPLQDFLQRTLGIKHIFAAEWKLGHKPDVNFTENNLKLSANIESGQKTGYFFDQRDNRKLVAHYAQGKTVLDAFCYSGGFSCNALAGGAKSVSSVDISADSIDTCKANVEANFGKDTRHQGITADCFDYLRQMKSGDYDLIVLDPPAFSKSAHTVERAARGYKDINLLALQKIASGGLLFTFSCSQHITPDLFRKIVFGAAKDAGRRVRIIHQMSQGADHPVDICHPEGEYLKGIALRVD